MVADYSFDVKNIDIWALAFFKHNNSFIATVTLQYIVQKHKLEHPVNIIRCPKFSMKCKT